MIDFMLPTFGQVDEGRQIAIGVESDVKLGGALFLLIAGSGEQ